MKAVVQRVSRARVSVADEVVGEIEKGLLVLLGVGHGDTEKEAAWMAKKLVGLRIFEDSEQKMNLSLLDVGGSVLVVSQFTLYGDCSKGRRPSFIGAAPPEEADRLYLATVEALKGYGCRVETGRFRADMAVELCNDGPVTLLLETPQKAVSS